MSDLILFGAIASGTAAVPLAALPGFRSDRTEFAKRFVYFLWRYCLPIWAFQELIFRIVFGRFFP
jgi:hypothetical protein